MVERTNWIEGQNIINKVKLVKVFKQRKINIVLSKRVKGGKLLKLYT